MLGREQFTELFGYSKFLMIQMSFFEKSHPVTVDVQSLNPPHKMDTSQNMRLENRTFSTSKIITSMPKGDRHFLIILSIRGWWFCFLLVFGILHLRRGYFCLVGGWVGHPRPSKLVSLSNRKGSPVESPSVQASFDQTLRCHCSGDCEELSPLGSYNS